MIKLNCDLGESFGKWKMGLDAAAMPYIDMANIACGFHAGDADVIAATLQLAKKHQVQIGAHPSYPDLQGFGRRSMALSHSEIANMLHYQIAALDGMAQCAAMQLSYVKPHGALYNDMMGQPAVFAVVLDAIAGYYRPLPLMLLATTEFQQYQHQAEQKGVTLIAEAFADRRYLDNGSLMPRTAAGAVLNEQQTLDQVRQLVQNSSVTTNTGATLTLQAQTLCVHGDNATAINQIAKIRELLA